MIKLFLTDIDGTLTDGSYYSPSIRYLDVQHIPASCEDRQTLIELPPPFFFRKFHTSDFVGIKMLHNAGILCAALSGSEQPSMPQFERAASWMQVFAGVQDKYEFIKTTYIDTRRYTWNDIAFIGDEINDCRLLEVVGVPACPSDAVWSVQQIVAKNDDGLKTDAAGGNKCVREFTDYIRQTMNIKASWCNWEEE